MSRIRAAQPATTSCANSWKSRTLRGRRATCTNACAKSSGRGTLIGSPDGSCQSARSFTGSSPCRLRTHDGPRTLLVLVADGPRAPERGARRVRGLVDEVPVDPPVAPVARREEREQLALPLDRARVEVRVVAREGGRKEREEVEAHDDAVSRRRVDEGVERGEDVLVDRAGVDHRARPRGPQAGAHEVDAALLHRREVGVPHVRVRLEEELPVDVGGHVRRADRPGNGLPSLRSQSRVTSSFGAEASSFSSFTTKPVRATCGLSSAAAPVGRDSIVTWMEARRELGPDGHERRARLGRARRASRPR